MDQLSLDTRPAKLSAAEQWTSTQYSAVRSRLRRWRQESWIAAVIGSASFLIVVGNGFLGLVDQKQKAFDLLGLDKCYMADPITGKPDGSNERPCLRDEVTFVRWAYPFTEDDDDVKGCDNRVFQVMKVKGDQIEWGEQRLRRAKGGKVSCTDGRGDPVQATWQTKPTRFYTALGDGEPVPTWQMLGQQEFTEHSQEDGFILRRIDIVNGTCGSKPDQPSGSINFWEFFVPNIKAPEQSRLTAVLRFFGLAPAPSCEPGASGQFVYARVVPAACGQPAGTAFEIGGDFSKGYNYPMTCVGRDR